MYFMIQFFFLYLLEQCLLVKPRDLFGRSLTWLLPSHCPFNQTGEPDSLKLGVHPNFTGWESGPKCVFSVDFAVIAYVGQLLFITSCLYFI